MFQGILQALKIYWCFFIRAMPHYSLSVGALLLLLDVVSLDPDVIEEYCETDIFHAYCPDGVVLIEEARYGRMGLGKCLTIDVGFMDCFSDVYPELDKWCSGQPSCDIPIMNLITITQPCPLEFRSYLEASYTCLPVVNPGPQCCHPENKVSVNAGNGYLASSVTEALQCGTRTCPWQIQAPNGQRISLHILDFGYPSERTKGVNANHFEDDCHAYAIINEMSAGFTMTVCAKSERRRHLYTTYSNSVEIAIVVQETEEKIPLMYFILEFQALGCADPILPKHSSLERDGNHAKIRCMVSEDISWDVVCSEGHWSGSYGNCSGLSSTDSNKSDVNSPWTAFKFNMAVIIIVVVAVTVSISFLVIGVICILRKYSTEHPARTSKPNTDRQQEDKTWKISNKDENFMDQHLALYADDNYVKPRDTFQNKPNATVLYMEETICGT